ncbi:MAG: 23S rRNA (adenine(2503)-C(2))-methyltransferase RlmN, partial [Bdellovibrionaceae bacterium]|nr:23S rRNA (adenine(2503)-C(2))-methyltransferase RlmN [Pseudobdellovibrionaceae bacterium]
MMPMEKENSIAQEFEPANFYSFTLEGLQEYLKKFGKEKFRAQQIYKWVYESRVNNVDEMSNLSKDFRAE